MDSDNSPIVCNQRSYNSFGGFLICHIYFYSKTEKISTNSVIFYR